MKNINLKRSLFNKSPKKADNVSNPADGQREPGKLITTRSGRKSFLSSIDDLKSRRLVTLDISGNTIKLLETRGAVVKRWASTPFVLGNSTSKDNPHNFELAVKQLMAKSGIKTSKVVLSINGLQAFNRILQSSTPPVELMSAEEIQTLINEEMALTLDQLYLSWRLIHPAGQEGQIYVISALRDVLDEQINSLKKVGINPSIIEFKAVTLCRIAGKKKALILNIEPSSFDVIVVTNSIPTISHTTAWKAADMDIDDQAEQLISAIDMAVDFHNSQHPEAVIETSTPLCVTGANSTDTDLMDKLRAMSDFDVETLEPPIDYPADFPLSEYTTNIGLALRDLQPGNGLLAKFNFNLSLKKPENHQTDDTWESLAINLLPKAYQPWRPSSRKVLAAAAVVLVAILIIPFYNVVAQAMNQTSVMANRYNNLNNELERRKLEIKNREPLLALVSEYNSISNTAGYLNKDLAVIRKIAGNLNVKMVSLVEAGKIINISCEADNRVLRQFANELMGSGRFVKIILPDSFWVYPSPSTVDMELESKMVK